MSILYKYIIGFLSSCVIFLGFAKIMANILKRKLDKNDANLIKKIEEEYKKIDNSYNDKPDIDILRKL